MRVRNVMMFAVLMASVLCARSSYALLHGPENPDDAQRVIDRAVAEHQFAVKQAQEREAMKIKNQEQIQKRFEELYKPSEANAHLPLHF
ncbi:MAG: hypothetical protein HY291_13330 [Planctomycetes bacterium]|nr:hypothetical protein [Planctomycetota bacterium]